MKRIKDPRYMLIGFGVAAILSIGALLGTHGYLEYQRQLATAEERLRSEARLLAEHAKLSIAAADFVLAEIEVDIQREGLDALTSDQSRWQLIRQTLSHAPHLDSLMVVNTDGRVLLTSGQFPAPDDLYIGDREYFLAHRNGQRHHIGTPVFGRSSGRQLIPVSIRLDGPDDEFAGVVVVAMNVAYFQSFYTSEPSELARRIGMYRRDGSVLSLYPMPPASVMPTLESSVANDLAVHRARSLVGASPVDGRDKIIAFRQLDGYPVAVSVATDYSRFIATLYPTWLRAALVFLVFSIGTGTAIYFIDRSMRAANRAREAHNVQLREISFTDGLLDIANRRAFDQSIAREWRRAMRQQSSVALLMIDVDHFKLFNDTYGHTRGDESLRHLAALLKSTVARPGDMVARYGGEEFAVLLPDSSLDGALHLAEQIHRHLADAALPFPNAPDSDRLTVSIGAAAIRVTPDSSPLALIQQADGALYSAKKAGRNRTVAAAAES